jgi:hypothetical protein
VADRRRRDAFASSQSTWRCDERILLLLGRVGIDRSTIDARVGGELEAATGYAATAAAVVVEATTVMSLFVAVLRIYERDTASLGATLACEPRPSGEAA